MGNPRDCLTNPRCALAPKHSVAAGSGLRWPARCRAGTGRPVGFFPNGLKQATSTRLPDTPAPPPAKETPTMSTDLSPIVSEFETSDQQASYTEWLRAKVAASLADPRPAIPHDEVERRMAQRLAQLRKHQVS